MWLRWMNPKQANGNSILGGSALGVQAVKPRLGQSFEVIGADITVPNTAIDETANLVGVGSGEALLEGIDDLLLGVGHHSHLSQAIECRVAGTVPATDRRPPRSDPEVLSHDNAHDRRLGCAGWRYRCLNGQRMATHKLQEFGSSHYQFWLPGLGAPAYAG